MQENIYTPYAGRQYSYGVLPFTIDSTRGDKPYVQYALLRQGGTLQPGTSGVSIPVDWSVDTTGPIFSVTFMITSGQLENITPSDFAELIKPTLTAAPLDSESATKNHTLTWDSSDGKFSMWGVNIPTEDKELTLDPHTQYCVTTMPLEASDLDALQTGVVHFSLMPTLSTTYDGVEVGILAVNYKLKKNKVVT